MCNSYVPASASSLSRQFGLVVSSSYRRVAIFPRTQGWFLRSSTIGSGRELVQGRWGLIPHFAKSADISYSTNNARSEELSVKASFKLPWERSQRCLIPADIFWEPCWETKRNVWWSFRRADGDAFALAGLWNTWIDRQTGEVYESYTMLTMNADSHPLFSRMHKPDPKLPDDEQDKRMVVVLEPNSWDEWLNGPADQARALIQQAPASIFNAEADSAPGSMA